MRQQARARKRERPGVWRNQRGVTLFMFAGLLLVLLGMAALAVDVGMLYTAQTQARRAADSAALAGAGWLLLHSGDPVGAKAEAEEFAEQHEIMGTTVDIDPALDVEVEGDTLVRVFVERAADRASLGGPISNNFARVLGIPVTDLRVQAAAVVAPGSSVEECLFPFIPPDAWRESDGSRSVDTYFADFDDAPTFDAASGDAYAAPDRLCLQAGDPFCWTAYTGWGAQPADQGRTFIARLPTSMRAGAGWWHVLNVPPNQTGGGANTVRAAINGDDCEAVALNRGDEVYVQTGNMESVAHELEDFMDAGHGPTTEAAAIACYRDPTATAECGDGLRIRTMALYDPNNPPREQGGGGGGGKGGGKGGGGGGQGDHTTPVGNFARVWLAGFCDDLAGEPACAVIDPKERDETFVVMYLGPTTSVAAGEGGVANPGSLAVRLVE